MALPTGSDGQSWKTFAPAPAVDAAAIERSLPTAAVITYIAPLGLYAECLDSGFVGLPQPIGTGSFTLVQDTSPDIQTLTWNLFTTTAPGVFDSILFAVVIVTGLQFAFSLNDGDFHFAFIEGYSDPLGLSGSRKGLLIESLSAQPNETVAESPHMSLEPGDFQSSLQLAGDMWFASGVLPVKPGLKMVDSAVSGVLYTGSFLTARATESLAELVTRFGTIDAPTQSYLGLNVVVVDEGFVTVNSGGIGPLVRNDIWGGGFFMPDSTSVALYGAGKDFLVPSGNFSALTDLEIISGSLNVFSGSILIQGNSSRLEISGTSASFFLNNQPVASVTVSNVRVDQITNLPALPDGIIYLTPSASTSNLDEAFFRASGTWAKLVSQSFDDVLDGGFFGT